MKYYLLLDATKAVLQDSPLQITSLNIEGKVKTNYSLAHVHGNLIRACTSTQEVLLYYLRAEPRRSLYWTVWRINKSENLKAVQKIL